MYCDVGGQNKNKSVNFFFYFEKKHIDRSVNLKIKKKPPKYE